MFIKEEIFSLDDDFKRKYDENKTFRDAIDALDEVGVSDRKSLIRVIMTLSDGLEDAKSKNKNLTNTLKRARDFIEITK